MSSAAHRHDIRVAHPTQFDGFTSSCSCGWRSEEMVDREAALWAAVEHLEELANVKA